MDVADGAPIIGRNAMTAQPVKALQALHADCEDVLQGLCGLRCCFRAMPGGSGLCTASPHLLHPSDALVLAVSYGQCADSPKRPCERERGLTEPTACMWLLLGGEAAFICLGL